MIRCMIALDKEQWRPMLVIVHPGGVLHDWHSDAVLELEPTQAITGQGDNDGPAYRVVNGTWSAIVPASELERVTREPIF